MPLSPGIRSGYDDSQQTISQAPYQNPDNSGIARMGIQPDRPGAIPAGRQNGKVAVADSCMGIVRNLSLDSLYKNAAYFEKAGL